MWAVLGLGNPGRKYSKTRHNVGFMLVDLLAGRHGLKFLERRNYLVSRGSIEGHGVVLVEPLTFMNLSGAAAREILRRYPARPDTLIVAHDDMDIDVGRIKIKAGGSSGGHKGIDSIIEHIGTRDFLRVRMGIGKDPSMPGADYVLRKFQRSEVPLAAEMLEDAADAVEAIITEGPDAAMNRFNRKPG